MKKYKKRKKYIIHFLIIFIIFTIGFAFITYFIPTSETMFCDINYSCFVEQKYAGFINIKKYIKLTQNSYITTKINHVANRRGIGHYVLLLSLDNKRIFMTNINSSNRAGYSSLVDESKKIWEAFNSYKKNPYETFYISSNANPGIYYCIICMLILGCVILAFFSISI